jgi:hypothetical protein
MYNGNSRSIGTISLIAAAKVDKFYDVCDVGQTVDLNPANRL